MNIRSQIGYIVSFIVRERNSRNPDKFLLRRLERELNTIIDSPTIEFTALPEQPMSCPPTELYDDEWTRSPEWRAEHAFLLNLC